MILIANSEAYPGIAETARQLQAGEDGLIASIEGIRLVESDFVLARLVHSKALCILSMLPIAL